MVNLRFISRRIETAVLSHMLWRSVRKIAPVSTKRNCSTLAILGDCVSGDTRRFGNMTLTFTCKISFAYFVIVFHCYNHRFPLRIKHLLHSEYWFGGSFSSQRFLSSWLTFRVAYINHLTCKYSIDYLLVCHMGWICLLYELYIFYLNKIRLSSGLSLLYLL